VSELNARQTGQCKTTEYPKITPFTPSHTSTRAFSVEREEARHNAMSNHIIIFQTVLVFMSDTIRYAAQQHIL